jgi:hypothetical protein
VQHRLEVGPRFRRDGGELGGEVRPLGCVGFREERLQDGGAVTGGGGGRRRRNGCGRLGGGGRGACEEQNQNGNS